MSSLSRYLALQKLANIAIKTEVGGKHKWKNQDMK